MSSDRQTTRRTLLRMLGVTAAAAATPLAALPAWAATDSATSTPATDPIRDEIVKLPIVFGGADFPEVVNGSYQGPNLVEASGIVASRRYPGVLWIIRDGYPFDQPEPVRSRYRNALYAISFNPGTGQLRRWPADVPSTYCDGYLRYVPMHDLDGSVPRMVSEDIALVPSMGNAPDTLWCGDIGNNNYGRHPGRLWRCSEPNPYTDPDVTLDGLLTYWTNPDHSAPQANCESLLALDGSLYLIIKGIPDGTGLAVGQVLRLPQQLGVTVDAVPVAQLQPPAGVAWHPSAADLDRGSLLVSTGTQWIRYEAHHTLTGDALIQALAAQPPVAYGFWNPDGTQSGNEGIAWLRTGARRGFMGAAEPGVLRWWPGDRTVAAR
ncbi:hypothetical protein [Streptomyces sp. NPDC000880]